MANDIKTWIELNRKLLAQARDLINATAEPSNIWRGARLDEVIAPMADDVVVADGVTKAQVAAISGMWGSFKYWIGTPMTAFSALFGLVPLIMEYDAAMLSLSKLINSSSAQSTMDAAQKRVDDAKAGILAAAGNIAQEFAADGDTPFHVIFGVK